MSMDRIHATMMKAWGRLKRVDARQRRDPPRAGRPRDPGAPPPTSSESQALGKPGFAEEALPWMDAVHRFALRLTRSGPEAEDLVQETYLRAFRSWHQFERGTNCRSWLFTICRNTHLHERERASSRYEITETDAAGLGDASSSLMDQRALAMQSPDDFFERIVDDRLLAAVDALPEEFRETLILSDLADLNHAEISEVLDIPVGTVKSRLFRARRQLRDTLLVHGMESAYADDADGRRGPDRGS
jgi:RNA polymerase sigma-70 factor, ECF subfamily